MNRCTLIAFGLIMPALAFAQTPDSRGNIQQVLGFEDQTGTTLTGWRSNAVGTAYADNQVVHNGHWSVRLQLEAQSADNHTTITRSIPANFRGTTVEFRGYLRLQNVSGFAGFWIREDADGEPLRFASMQPQQIKGTRDWARYSVSLPIDPKTQRFVFGIQLIGGGTLWADDAELLVDGKPIAEAPPAAQPVGLPDDHEFDKGSRITLPTVTPLQITNLATLARVWGFLKYQHPTVTSGQRHWDYELFRIMPPILAAPDRDSANTLLLGWIERLGPVTVCKQCLSDPVGDLSEKPDLAWLKDRALLGNALSERLQSIHANRTGRQFYVSVARLGNPSFDHELSYPGIKFPDSGYQLLALFRWWNILQNWSPYRETAGQDWNAILSEFIPKLALAEDKTAYLRALFQLLAKANDTHANLWSSQSVLPPTGDCAVPVRLRFIEDQAVVDHVDSPDAGLQLGDIINAVDDTPVVELVQRLTPFYPASNDAARKRDLAAFLTRGGCGPVSLGIKRSGHSQLLTSIRTKFTRTTLSHDTPGDTFRFLSPDIAYVKLSDIKAADLPAYFDKAKDTKGLIVDIRNYPSEFMPFAMGSYFVTKPTPFVRFALMDPANPGAFSFSGGLPHIRQIEPGPVHYNGRVVVLVDEASQSQSEYTAMALRAAPNVLVAGSTTAGADGDISEIPLPGGGTGTVISGIGIYYPDRRPTQRVGIVPDIVAKPTVHGIASGHDEVLDIAVDAIEGRR